MQGHEFHQHFRTRGFIYHIEWVSECPIYSVCTHTQTHTHTHLAAGHISGNTEHCLQAHGVRDEKTKWRAKPPWKLKAPWSGGKPAWSAGQEDTQNLLTRSQIVNPPTLCRKCTFYADTLCKMVVKDGNNLLLQLHWICRGTETVHRVRWSFPSTVAGNCNSGWLGALMWLLIGPCNHAIQQQPI